MPIFGTSLRHCVWFGMSWYGLVSTTIGLWAGLFCWATLGKLLFKPWFGLYSWAFVAYTLLFDLALVCHWRAMTTVGAPLLRHHDADSEASGAHYFKRR